LKDTFLQLIDITEGKKRQVRLKAYRVCQMKLEGTQYKLTTEIAQKSRDSMLLIGARVRGQFVDDSLSLRHVVTTKLN
jgi:hypothetical protein